MIAKISMASLALKYNGNSKNDYSKSLHTPALCSPSFGMNQDKFIKTLSLEEAVQALSTSFEPGEIKFSSPNIDKNGILGQMFLKYKVYSKDNHAVSLDFATEQGKSNGHQTLSLGPKNKVQEDLKNPDFIVKIQNAIEDFVTKRERSNS